MFSPNFYPKGFPGEALECLHENLSSNLEPGEDADRITRALMGVAIRYRTAHEAVLTLVDHLETHEGEAPEELQFAHESALFTFISAGQSAIECACFAAYCVANRIVEAKFAVDAESLGKLSPDSIADAWKKQWPRDAMTRALAYLKDDPEWGPWRDSQSVLSNRGYAHHEHGIHAAATEMSKAIGKDVRVGEILVQLYWLTTTCGSLIDGMIDSSAVQTLGHNGWSHPASTAVPWDIGDPRAQEAALRLLKFLHP